MGMSKHFSVVSRQDTSAPAMFDGSAKEVADWLKAGSDVSGYLVCSTDGGYYYTVREFLKIAAPIFVNKFYMMDPDVEDFLPTSSHLADGMVVLLADNNKLASEKDMENDWGMDRAMERNRWCTVSDIRWNRNNNKWDFTATYDDGSKRLRKASPNDAWLVKLKSIPQLEDTLNEIAAKMDVNVKVRELVKAAMAEAIKTEHLDLTERSRALRMGKTIVETSKKIVDLLG